jgi:hypothetical protein
VRGALSTITHVMGVSEGGSAADLAGARAGFAAGMTASEAGRGIGQLGIGIGMESEEGQYWVGVCFSPSGLRAGVAWRVCSIRHVPEYYFELTSFQVDIKSKLPLHY